MKLESNRIILRPSTFDDCTYFDEWERKAYIKKFFSINDSRNYEEIIREYIVNESNLSKMQFTIVLRDTTKPIGRIYISRLDSSLSSLDITRIYIGEELYLGKGLGKETMILLLKYLFEDLKMERITLDTFKENTRAQNLYHGLGFKDEGILRNSTKKNNQYYDLHLMSMISKEYFDSNYCMK